MSARNLRHLLPAAIVRAYRGFPSDAFTSVLAAALKAEKAGLATHSLASPP